MNGQSHSYLKELPVVSHDAVKRAVIRKVPALKGTVELKVAEDERDAHVGSTVWPCGTYLVDSLVDSAPVRAAFVTKKAAAAGADTGDASAGAAEFTRGMLEGTRVLDIGGGTGYVAMGLAVAGAAVTTTDMDDCVPLLEHNAEIYNNTVARELPGSGHLTVAALDWTAVDKSAIALPSFDVMVVCECFYAISNLGHSLLVDLMVKFLKQPGGRHRVVMAFEERDDDIEGSILTQLKAAGARITALRKSAPVTKGESNKHPDPVHYQILLATMSPAIA